MFVYVVKVRKKSFFLHAGLWLKTRNLLTVIFHTYAWLEKEKLKLFKITFVTLDSV